ncbi:MAG: hypothetical protein JWL98_1973, partial [Xanthomonadaceae bacterium]|nr:hypothetical protein [Xanthomonadaceae bacterium]
MLVTRTLPASTDLLALHRLSPRRYPMLLESSAAGSAQGRWDLLLATNGELLTLEPDGITRRQDGECVGNDFLHALDAQWQATGDPGPASPWPFRGGWALYLGYALAGQIEPVVGLPPYEGGLPIAVALRCPAAVLRDHRSGQCTIIAEPAYAAMLDAIAQDGADAGASLPHRTWQPPVSVHEDDPKRFIDGVGRILDYLAAGDVFQVNLSRQWRARFDDVVDPAMLFARLRDHNPAPFAGMFALGGQVIVSASPERLVC